MSESAERVTEEELRLLSVEGMGLDGDPASANLGASALQLAQGNGHQPEADHNSVYRHEKAIRTKLAAYDIADPRAAHLRGHQVEAVQNFRDTVLSIVGHKQPKEGMVVLHPTGSGKTVTATEIIRMLSDTDAAHTEPPLKSLVLIPGHQIKEQTLGNEDELGAIRTFAPGVSVGEYSGYRKTTDATVTVMTYQSLPGAVASGSIEKIDPAIVVCDEAHHIIDGTWAEAVESISRDRIRVGLTATGEYSKTRNVSLLFPHILAEKSMIEGIEEGILAEMQGFVYKGSSRISVAKHGADYDEEGLFNDIANSEDNFLAAKICAEEVKMGRRGVISCVPGFDRAHAKIMAEILSHTKVETAEGERYIRAAFVGGEIHPDYLRKIFKDYRNGQVDVITYVNLLLEGWDSPQSDFTVLLRPTASRVLAEQRIGRIIRPRPGKIATVHEIIYETTGEAVPQVTHMDIMESTTVKQGYTYGAKRTDKTRANNRKYKEAPAHIFDIGGYTMDPELASKIAELDATPLKEIKIACGQEAIPFDWPTAHLLSSKFDISIEKVEEILGEANLPSKSEVYDEVERTYYPKRASTIIAEHLDLPLMPEDYMTLAEIVAYHKSFKQHPHVRRLTVMQALEEAGVKREIFLREDGTVVKAYPPSAKGVPPFLLSDEIRRRGKQPTAQEVLDAPGKTAQSLVWLEGILTNPTKAPSLWQRREIITAQSCLLAAIKKLSDLPPSIYMAISNEIKASNLVPTDQMLSAMQACKIDFVGLVAATNKALVMYRKMETSKSQGSKSDRFI